MNLQHENLKNYKPKQLKTVSSNNKIYEESDSKTVLNLNQRDKANGYAGPHTSLHIPSKYQSVNFSKQANNCPSPLVSASESTITFRNNDFVDPLLSIEPGMQRKQPEFPLNGEIFEFFILILSDFHNVFFFKKINPL
jgi:hypothetical protein